MLTAEEHVHRLVLANETKNHRQSIFTCCIPRKEELEIEEEELRLGEEMPEVDTYFEVPDPTESTQLDTKEENAQQEDCGEKPVLMPPPTSTNIFVALLQAIMTLFLLKFYPPSRQPTASSPSK